VIVITSATTTNTASPIGAVAKLFKPAESPNRVAIVFWSDGGADGADMGGSANASISRALRCCLHLARTHTRVIPVHIFNDRVDGIPGGVRVPSNQLLNRAIASLRGNGCGGCKGDGRAINTISPSTSITNTTLDSETVNTTVALHHLGFLARDATADSYIAQMIVDTAGVGVGATAGANTTVVVCAGAGLINAIQLRLREINWATAEKPDCASLFDNHKFVDRNRLEAYWFNKLDYAIDANALGHQPANWATSSLAQHTANTTRIPAYNLRKNNLFNYVEEHGYGDIVNITTLKK
jgi:hypothetical protein